MGYRYVDFAPGEVYHVCARSVGQRKIFIDDEDRERFLALIIHCLPRGITQSYSTAKRLKQEQQKTDVSTGPVDLLCYCLMTNHVHLLLKENYDCGTSAYLQRLLNSYARYFNIRHKRTGPLFAGPFRAVAVDGDEQLLHVSRYIHLNPYVVGMTKDPFIYEWSSLSEYIGWKSKYHRCHTGLIRSMMPPGEYRAFVSDHADYARELAEIKHLLLEDDA
ncbi:MAG: transposase [bacterium]